jgi:hypothetical protein
MTCMSAGRRLAGVSVVDFYSPSVPALSGTVLGHQVPPPHSKVETTKNIYGHLFAWDRAAVLDAMNQAVSRLYAYDMPGEDSAATGV